VSAESSYPTSRMLTAAEIARRRLVKEQGLLELARRRDFLRNAIWTRRVALVATLDSLALHLLSGKRALAICVEYRSLAHCDFPCRCCSYANAELEKFRRVKISGQGTGVSRLARSGSNVTPLTFTVFVFHTHASIGYWLTSPVNSGSMTFTCLSRQDIVFRLFVGSWTVQAMKFMSAFLLFSTPCPHSLNFV
jgi:hypothetical protein